MFLRWFLCDSSNDIIYGVGCEFAADIEFDSLAEEKKR